MRPAVFIQRDHFAVDYGIVRQIGECLHHPGKRRAKFF